MEEQNEQRTVQSVFDKAIRIMDEQNESSGSTTTADTKVYALRTPDLLNTIFDRCIPASTYPLEALPGRRPVVKKVKNMVDMIELDETVCTGILPYGLAGLLLTEEDPSRANFYWQTFLEQIDRNTINKPAVETSIDDVYGGIEYGEFADW